jgi:hypothetical protein
MLGTYTDLIAEFDFRVDSQIDVTGLGSQTLHFGSYIGVGNAGVLDPLQEQLHDRFVERHDKFFLNPPPGAEYIWVHFPATPVSAYSGSDPTNIQLPSSGTYRLANGPKDLSVDHTVSMGLPLYGEWLDADLLPVGDPTGSVYLPLLPRVDTISAPEYFVPTGVGYDPCMTRGDCPEFLLDQIYATQMEMTVHYFAVEQAKPPLDRIPLRQVGPNWDPPANTLAVQQFEQSDTAVFPRQLFVPLITSAPADEAATCPCGWFAADGRMLDFTPGP